MKKSFVFLAVFVFAISVQAQTEKDVFDATEITWFGLDFSKALFVGSFTQFAEAGGKSGDQIKDKFFPAWNDVISNEREKFDLKKAYNKTSVLYNLDIVTKRNSAVDADKMMTLNAQESRLSKDDISKVVSAYKTSGSGIGLLYIVDSFNKAEEKGVIWVTFFDIATRKVLITEKFSEKPGGFGLRNYWVKPVFEIMMKHSHEAYKKWSK